MTAAGAAEARARADHRDRCARCGGKAAVWVNYSARDYGGPASTGLWSCGCGAQGHVDELVVSR